jgi:hypothetical protein
MDLRNVNINNIFFIYIILKITHKYIKIYNMDFLIENPRGPCIVIKKLCASYNYYPFKPFIHIYFKIFIILYPKVL